MSAYQPASGRGRAPEKKPKPPRPARRLTVLALLIIAVVSGIGFFSARSSEGWTPKLALDLQGGTQIILAPVLDPSAGDKQVTSGDINQAIAIIRQRVDASGVAEAEITSQAGNTIVVGLPGTPSEETLDLVERSAVLRFRPVLAMIDPAPIGAPSVPPTPPSEAPSASATAAPSAAPSTAPGAAPAPSASEAPSAAGSEAASQAPSEAPSAGGIDEELRERLAFAAADQDKDGKLSDTPAGTPTSASDSAWITEQLLYEAYLLDCQTENRPLITDNPDKPQAACSSESGVHAVKYLLGPAELQGTDVKRASSSPATNEAGVQTGGFQVNLEFNSHGASAFTDITSRLISLPEPTNRFAIVLDGEVLTAASPSTVINTGSARITGDFTSGRAATLANQLNFGSLPLTFEVQSKDQISATLGSEQLRTGLIAGVIGLLLVVLYMMFMYQGLGLVAVSSIGLATGITYLMLTLLGYTHGYRLSLPGVVGIIISIGITADSFIVYFERIRDEIRDGLSLKAAVDTGWSRALRTIVVSDIVNFVAAAVLYLLAVGGVRGFAFTLGLTTVIDLVIVVMFTRPVMQLLTKTKFFGQGHRFSGMSPESLGQEPGYVGRGQFREKTPAPKAARSAKRQPVAARASSDRKLTIAERRALAAKQAKEKSGPDHGSGEGAGNSEAQESEGER